MTRWVLAVLSLLVTTAATSPPGDELLFYREEGDVRMYETTSFGQLGTLITTGQYSAGWDIIASVDIEGDGTQELFFYRSPGIFAYYDVSLDGQLGAPINSGSGYSHKWDQASGVDLDGDGQDEMFFYDRGIGLFSYNEIDAEAQLGAPIYSDTGYSLGWDIVTSMDLEGDGSDEMFFYRNDGTFKVYDLSADGRLSKLINSGTLSAGWRAIVSLDLDGDGSDEMMFYREDGSFKYYDLSESGRLSALLLAGTGYSQDWDTIVALDVR